MKVIPIDINKFEGVIPQGYDLCVYEEGGECFVLYGFDEIGEFDCLLQNPQYGFVAQ